MADSGDSFLAKQGRFLLENDRYAFLCIGILALLPFTTWLATAAIALITLRKGWLAGFKSFIVGTVVSLCLSLMSMSFFAAWVNVLSVFLSCYLLSLILRVTANWRLTAGIIVLQALLAIALIQWLAPDYALKYYQYIQNTLNEYGYNGMLARQSHQEVYASYMLGVRVLSVVLSTLVSLLLARSVQATLFNPGGYRQEMLAFRASVWGIPLLMLVLLNAYQGNLLAVACMPVLVLYYVAAGISLSFNILVKNRGRRLLLLLFIPLILLPSVMLPFYVILGTLDSFFNFRSLQLLKAGKK